MNCKTVQNQLSAYLDRELSGNELLIIRRHLSECQACREEEEALRTLKHFLIQTPAPEPPADLADRLCAAVLAADRKEVRAEVPSRRLRFRTSLFTFAGVAACSMVVTFVTLHGMTPPQPELKGVTTADALKTNDLVLDVQRDAVYAAGLDATYGAPVISSVDNVGP